MAADCFGLGFGGSGAGLAGSAAGAFEAVLECSDAAAFDPNVARCVTSGTDLGDPTLEWVASAPGFAKGKWVVVEVVVSVFE